MSEAYRKKYNKKKLKTLKERKVGWELTLQQFSVLYEKSTVCDYTGVKFNSSSPELHKSIERIDKNLPYRADNCCVVTHKVNQLKDMLEDNCGRVKVEDMELIAKIKNTLKTKTRQSLINKYFPDIKVGEHKMTPVKENLKNTSEDLEIAKKFIGLHEHIPDLCISFNHYKKLYKRKTCQITRKDFDKDKRIYYRKDGNKPWTDDNVMVVCNTVYMIMESGLTVKQIERVCSYV